MTYYAPGGEKIDIEAEYEVLWLDDYKSQKPVKVEVNWNSAVKPTEFIRLTLEGTNQQLILNRTELQTLMFLFAPTEDEDKYLRTQTNQLKRNRHEFRVKANRDIKKGDDVVINKYIT